ncbi:DUF6090 family protein [Gaetbulibacter aestuarii]|uniref:DUF6090 family protein n=1 Tax=Gaetbulibacter aestuarii TaxID=1502358 RepID=A0ABW7N310_9FLAO
MIKFFRKIRQKLLSENKFSKYLFYAIGEIVLVVIGILIALQINNWNEQNKSESFELKMLGEIYKSLSYDNYILEHILNNRILPVDSSINAILSMYEAQKIDLKEFNQHASKIQNGYIFSYSSGPYETLKIAGLDKVKNDTLRDKLIFHYDYELPRRIKLIESANNDQYYQKLRDLELEIFDYKITTHNNSKEFEILSYKLDNPQDPLFIKYLQMRNHATKRGISNFKNYLKESKFMIKLLKEEFGRRHYEIPEFIINN